MGGVVGGVVSKLKNQNHPCIGLYLAIIFMWPYDVCYCNYVRTICGEITLVNFVTAVLMKLV